MEQPKECRTRLLVTTCLSAALLLGGCGPRVGAGETAAQAGAPAAGAPAAGAPAAGAPAAGVQASAPAPPLLLDLPALVLTYNADGVPSIGDLPVADLHALLPEPLIGQLTLDAATVQQMTDAGIQHIMVSNTPAGLRILVNGQPLPALVWDQESLDNLLALLGEADQPAIAALGDLVSTALNLGVGLVVQFPPAAGAAPLPLIAAGEQSNAARAQVDRQAFLEQAGAAPAIQIPVQYTVDGTWSVGGVTDTEWQALTGLPFGYVRLNPQLLRDAAAAGIAQVQVWTDADGLHATVGDRRLPYLRWADGGLYTLIDLLLRLHVIGGAGEGGGGEDDGAALAALLEQWLPALQATDLRIVVNFPAP